LTARVAVDAMGGDRGPDEVVAGALAAAADGIVPVLYGPASLDARGLEHVAAEQVIAMDDKPAEAVRAKPSGRGRRTRWFRPGTRAPCSRPGYSRSGGCQA
jgi:fatty acid/phospholipid biosynthesis enzyme